MPKKNYDKLQEDIERKAAKKRKRKKPMPVSGKSVFTLKKTIEQKPKRSLRKKPRRK